MHDVFISYSTEEFNQAEHIRQTLEANGIHCWFAPSTLRGSQKFVREIPAAIRSAKAFLLLISGAAQRSSWVQRELVEAASADIPIFTFYLEDCALSEEFGFMLNMSQRYSAALGFETQLRRLLGDLGDLLKNPIAEPVFPPPNPVQKRKTKAPAIGVMAAVLVIAGILLLGRYGRTSPGPASAHCAAALPGSAIQLWENIPGRASAPVTQLLEDVQYTRQVLEEMQSHLDRGDSGAAMAAIKAGVRRLPQSQQLMEAFLALAEQYPVDITNHTLTQQFTPDDGLTFALWEQWDPDTDRDLNMNRWSGGVRVAMNRLFSGVLFVDREITHRLSWTFAPADHTSDHFVGYIVPDDAMYGGASRGTVRILVDGVEVFSTGEFGSDCREIFPFEVNIVGVETIVFEASAEVDGEFPFSYGIVS